MCIVMICDYRCIIFVGVVVFDFRKRVVVCLVYSLWFGVVINWIWVLVFIFNGLVIVLNEN